MTGFKIATWNVNSLRVRLPQVETWLNEHQPDVLALQETKMTDEDFPVEALEVLGYHSVYSGQKTYNGVALLSRHPIIDVIKDIPELEDHQRRVLCATINDIRVLNVYIPNGESVTSEKYHYKLKWLSHLERYLKHELKSHPNMIILGDFNIAPTAMDVYDESAWKIRCYAVILSVKLFRQCYRLGFAIVFACTHQVKNVLVGGIIA